MNPTRTHLPAAALSLLVLLAVAGCGGEAPGAGTTWIIPTDGGPWPDTLAGEDAAGDGSADSSCDFPDLCAPQDTADGEAGLLCTPGERSCDGADVIECGGDGLAWESLGDCDDGDFCTEDQCLGGECLNEALGSCCEPPCPLGQLCFNGECVCASQCFGKECGDDGCGGTCGECPLQHHCSPAGQCTCDPDCAGPDGTEKECGDDGCGDACGFCLGPQDLCLEGLCVCQPACEAMECGPDGCGADCGVCPAQHQCSPEGQCVCVPDCAGKTCGGDGCGGLCGECAAPLYLCDAAGQCVQDPAFSPVLGACTPHLLGPTVYYICWQAKKWDDAKDYCADNGTWLATITSQAEQDFLAGLAGAAGQTLWIGLSQGFWEWDSFEWVTGEGKPVEFWGEGEPNDGGFFESEDCGEMHPAGFWNDERCGDEQWFFCEHSS